MHHKHAVVCTAEYAPHVMHTGERIEATPHRHGLQHHWRTLDMEYGGMNDVLWRLAALSGRADHRRCPVLTLTLTPTPTVTVTLTLTLTPTLTPTPPLTLTPTQLGLALRQALLPRAARPPPRRPHAHARQHPRARRGGRAAPARGHGGAYLPAAHYTCYAYYAYYTYYAHYAYYTH